MFISKKEFIILKERIERLENTVDVLRMQKKYPVKQSPHITQYPHVTQHPHMYHAICGNLSKDLSELCELFYDSKLKKCPFCGSEARINRSQSTGVGFEKQFQVGCFNKDCNVKPSAKDVNFQKAVEKWNS